MFKRPIHYALITNNFRAGQALVTLLVFTATALTITAGAVIMTIVNTQGTTKYELGEETLLLAETGADNAILRVIREPSYSGETITLGNGTATIIVSGASSKTIVSEGTSGSFKRKIQVDGTMSNNVFIVDSWREID